MGSIKIGQNIEENCTLCQKKIQALVRGPGVGEGGGGGTQQIGVSVDRWIAEWVDQ